MKEAKWNKKYLLSLKSVDTLYKGSWKEIAEVIEGLMGSIRSIYEKSNYYKEVRVVNFLDHMYQHLIIKMKREFTIAKILSSTNIIQQMNETLDYCKIINTKFDEGFFIKELMYASKPSKHNFMNTMTGFSKSLAPLESSMRSTQSSYSIKTSIK